MSTPSASAIDQEMQVFTQIRGVLNMILPMINLIPFLDPNLKKQVQDL